jgi:RHS repeat-associated protein
VNVLTSVCSGEKYPYGYNGKYKDNEWAGKGNHYDYGFRMHDTRIARFISVDPLSKKFPMLTPYQYASNTPIQAIDLDGAEGWSVSGILFKQAGFTTATEQHIMSKSHDAMQRAGNVSKDVLGVAGGVAGIVVSGGGALPWVLGGIAIGGNGAKVYYDAKGDNKTAQQIPTTVSGSLMQGTNIVAGEQVFSQNVINVAEFVEGASSLKTTQIFSKSANVSTKVNEVSKITSTVLDLKGALNSGADALTPAGIPSRLPIPAADATRVNVPINTQLQGSGAAADDNGASSQQGGGSGSPGSSGTSGTSGAANGGAKKSGTSSTSSSNSSASNNSGGNSSGGNSSGGNNSGGNNNTN